MKRKQIITNVFYFISTAIILCIPALYNRYLLYYTDSSLYLSYAIKLIPSIDRPIGYGYFIRAVTWQYSMWLVIFYQGLIASLLLYHTFKTVLVKIAFKKTYHFITICVLSIFSTLGWYVSLLMPDVFTSFLILALFNILFGKNTIISYVLYSVLLFFIVFSHLSNIPVLALILITIWIFILLKKKFTTFKKNIIWGTLITVVVYLGTVGYLLKYNYDHYQKASLSPSGGIFFFAKLIDTGVIDIYLKDNCDKKNYMICQYKDSIPRSSQTFLWDFSSPFYKLGAWTYYQAEPKQIVHDILSSPKYYGIIIKDFTLSTFKQLLEFKIGGDLLNFRVCATDVYDNAFRYYPRNEIKRDFYYSKQLQDEFKFDTLNNVIYLVVFLSVIMIAIVLGRYKIDEKVYFLLVAGFSGVFYNAAVSACLSNVLNRYQARVVWIIPLIAIILFLNYIFPKIISLIRKQS